MENNLTNSSEDQMLGSMFVLLKRFVEHLYDYSTWIKLTEEAGIKDPSYQMNEMYPTRDLFALVLKASELAGIPTYEFLEQYGQFLVPDLMLIYKKYVRPEWRTYDMLLNTEEAMHYAARKKDDRANPPKLLVTKKGSKQLIVDYHSKRRMAGVAVGIIKGIAKYYKETEFVKVTCLSGAHEERVQIKVDFLE